jgi:hypothetical protein
MLPKGSVKPAAGPTHVMRGSYYCRRLAPTFLCCFFVLMLSNRPPSHNDVRTLHQEQLHAHLHAVAGEKAGLSQVLGQLETRLSREWNHSVPMAILVGQKAKRDFGVYDWAFSAHRIRVVRPKDGVLWLEGRQTELLGVGAILCHSIFTDNCFRFRSRMADPRSWIGATPIYRRLGDGRKVNRLSGAHQALTTKDGMCGTLRYSGLPPDVLASFTFPCWSLPLDAASLRMYIASRLAPSTAEAYIAGQQRALWQRPSPMKDERWIMKPRRGSQGKGIHVVNTSYLRELMNAAAAHAPLHGAVIQVASQ